MSELIDKAKALRPVIEVAAQSLSDEQAVYAPELFEAWDPNGREYEAGRKVRFEGVLYKALQAHTSQPAWRPDAAPSLFARILIPDPEVIPEWVQPDSTNAYMKHDVVRHHERIWESQIDNNVWEPGVSGTESLWANITGNESADGEETENSQEDGQNPEDTAGTETDPSPGQEQDPAAEEPADPVEAWVQPIGAHDAYNTGDIVLYDGKKYICTINANVYTPGVYGWDEMTD